MATPVAASMSRALRHAFGSEVSVDSFRRVSGGASRETWLFDAHVGDESYPLVLRRDPGASAGHTERSTEFQLLAAAASAGVPVPTVRVLLEPDDGLGVGFIMDRVDGETIPRKILRDDTFANARPRLAAQCGAILGAIHSVPLHTLPSLATQGATTQLHQYRAILDTFGEPHAAFELGLRWMEERAAGLPSGPSHVGLVHGDFRNGNFIVGPDGIRAVLDWELAHLGDPIEDLGWLCVRAWRFGNTANAVGGFGTIPSLLDAYEAAGGRRPSDDELRFWIALGTLKWGVICLVQAFTHLNGLVRSVELAAIGRRVGENEWDLLNLINGEW